MSISLSLAEKIVASGRILYPHVRKYLEIRRLREKKRQHGDIIERIDRVLEIDAGKGKCS